MFSQVSYCKQDKEQYENVENKTNHMKNTKTCFQRGKPNHPKKKKKKKQNKTKQKKQNKNKKTKTKTKNKKQKLSVNHSSKNFTNMNSCKTWVTINSPSLYLPM